MARFYLILFMISIINEKSGALRCYHCRDIILPRLCETLATCAADEICFVNKTIVHGVALYNSGCVVKTYCTQTATIIGRREDVERRGEVIRAPINISRQCCTNNYCNNEGFGNSDIPRQSRGPHCFQCSYGVDASECQHVMTCSISEACTITKETLSSSVFYTSKCTAKSTCSAMHTKPECDSSCCVTDYCNDQCIIPTTITPTQSFELQIQRECLKRINDGYFFDSFTNLCVKVVKSSSLHTQSQAGALCKSENASLISIYNEDEQDFVLSWIFSHQENNTDFWISAKANVSKSHVYYWADGSRVTYNHWEGIMMGQPDDRRTKNENCVFLNDKDMYYWHDDQCTALKTGYICEIWNVTAADKVRACRRHVFDGYYYDGPNDLCLMFHNTQTPTYTYQAAVDACSMHGASLAIVDTETKTDFILRWIFTNKENATDFWIGAKDINNTSEFYWPNGAKLSYTHWGGPVFPPEPHGQPDANFGVLDEDCVYMDHAHEYYWFDEKCSAIKNGFVCQYFGVDKQATEHECRNRLVSGYFYDDTAGMCIKFYNNNVNRNMARQRCQSEGSDLVVIDNAHKMDFVLELMFYGKANISDYWIGGKDIYNNNTFFWEPAKAHFSWAHWYTLTPPEPEDCAILDNIQTYLWKPIDCNSLALGYVCQINKYTMGHA